MGEFADLHRALYGGCKSLVWNFLAARHYTDTTACDIGENSRDRKYALGAPVHRNRLYVLARHFNGWHFIRTWRRGLRRHAGVCRMGVAEPFI